MANAVTSPRADVTPEPVEVEVKFGVAFPEHVRHLLERPDAAALAGFVPAGPLRMIVVVDRYMDTAVVGGSLYLAGVRARLRITDVGVVLTVKRRGTLDTGITTRTEIEAPATAVLDPIAWPASDARTVLLETAAGEQLAEIAALRQRRLVRDVERGSTRVELSLDEMDALDGEAVVDRRVELEAELKAGPVEALQDLAAALQEIEGVGPPQGSKLDFALGSRVAAERSGASER
jgi:inorganic triphosphatase YgiF